MSKSEKKRADLFRARVACLLKDGYTHTRNIVLQIKGDAKGQAQ